MKIVAAMPESAMLTELGERAQHRRVGLNLTQVELAKSAGVSPRTVERLEGGKSVQLDNLLKILRALRLVENLDQLLPEASIRPIQLATSTTAVRQRARKRRGGQAKPKAWVWGDRK